MRPLKRQQSNIYTLTPNPALDLSGHVSAIISNEKNYVYNERRDPGGNGINAARLARRMGSTVHVLGFIGGPTGSEIEHMLHNEGVSCEFTRIKSNTRTNVTATNDSTHEQTRLTFPGPVISRGEMESLLKTLKNLRGPGLFVLGGSLPRGCPPDFHARVAATASKLGLAIVIDVPARALKSYLKKGPRPLLVKPNLTELEELFARPLQNQKALHLAAKNLAKHADVVCVSLGGRGALIAHGTSLWFARAPRIKARGTVGAGDSMVGAMVSRMAALGIHSPSEFDRNINADNRPIPQLISDLFSWGVGAGAATAAAEGTAMASISRIRRLRSNVQICRLA